MSYLATPTQVGRKNATQSQPRPEFQNTLAGKPSPTAQDNEDNGGRNLYSTQDS